MILFFKTLTGKTYSIEIEIEVDPNKTIKYLKEKLEKMLLL